MGCIYQINNIFLAPHDKKWLGAVETILFCFIFPLVTAAFNLCMWNLIEHSIMII